YLNIYNNYFKAPWMPDRTEANPNELNQDDARYGFRCCHLKNIWTAPLPPETELSRQMRIFLMSRKIILIKQELLLLVYELNRSGLLAENEKIRPILAQLEKLLLCDLSPSTN